MLDIISTVTYITILFWVSACAFVDLVSLIIDRKAAFRQPPTRLPHLTTVVVFIRPFMPYVVAAHGTSAVLRGDTEDMGATIIYIISVAFWYWITKYWGNDRKKKLKEALLARVQAMGSKLHIVPSPA